MTPYFYIYGLVASGILICFLGDSNLRRVAQGLYFVSVLLVLALFAGMRSPSVDRDFQNYVIWFDLIKSGDAPIMAWLRDPAFGLLSWIATRIGLSYSAVAFVYAFLGLLATASFAMAVVSRRWATLFFYLLFCEYFVVLEMTEIRAAVAIPLMGLSLWFACQNQRRKAIVVFLIGLVFHFSIIVALPFLVLILTGTRFRTRAWLYSLIAVGAVASIALRSVLDALSGIYRISEYLNGAAGQANDVHVVSWLAVVDRLVILLPAVFLWRRLNLHQRMATVACAMGITLFLIFGSNSDLATRLLYVFDLYSMLILMTILDKLQPESKIFYIALLVGAGLALYCKSLELIEPYSTFHEWDAMLRAPIHALPLLR